MTLVDFNITAMETNVTNLSTLLTDLSKTVTDFDTQKASLSSIWAASESSDFASHVENCSAILGKTVTRYQEYITFLTQAIAVAKGDVDDLAAAINGINIGDGDGDATST